MGGLIPGSRRKPMARGNGAGMKQEIKMRDFVRIHTGIATSILSVLVLAGAVTVLSACNTTAGVGKDVSATGHAVTNSAEKVKDGM
jgi:entericidin B